MQCVCYVCATCVLCAVYSVQVMRGMWQPCAVWLALVCVWGLPCVLLATVWLWRLACPSPVVSVGRTEREGLPPGNVGCCALEAALRGSGDQGLRPPLLTLHSDRRLVTAAGGSREHWPGQGARLLVRVCRESVSGWEDVSVCSCACVSGREGCVCVLVCTCGWAWLDHTSLPSAQAPPSLRPRRSGSADTWAGLGTISDAV